MDKSIGDQGYNFAESRFLASTSRLRAALWIAPGLASLAWLVFVTIRLTRVDIAVVARPSIFHPEAWILSFEIIAAFSLFGGIFGLIAPRSASRFYLGVVAAVVGATALWILAVPSVVTGTVAFFCLLVLCYALGDWLLGLLFGQSKEPGGVERTVFSIALALGLFSHLTLGLALVGALYPEVIVAIFVVASIAARRQIVGTLLALYRLPGTFVSHLGQLDDQWAVLPLITVLAGWFILDLVQCVAPEIQYDALNYHLALPKIFIEQHRFVVTPYNMQSWFYFGTEMDYLLAMLIGGQVAAKLVNLTFGILAALAIYSTGRRFFSPRAALVGTALFATAPLVAWETSTTYIDVAQSCYCFLAATSVYRWLVERRISWLVVAGLVSGFAISAKVNSIFLVATITALVTVVWIVRPGWSGGRTRLTSISCGAVLVASSAPWPLLRFIQTGNPVFPFYNGVFRSPLWAPVNETFDFAKFGTGTSPIHLLRMPWDVTFAAQAFGGGPVGAVIGMGFVLLPLLALTKPVPRCVPFFLGILLAFGAAWAFSVQLLRYLLPVLPFVCVLAGQSVAGISERIWPFPFNVGLRAAAGILPVGWMLLCLPLFASLYWNIPERIPFAVAFGLESRSHYLSRVLPEYDAFQAMIRDGSSRDFRTLSLSVNGEDRLYGPGAVETMNSSLVQQLLRTSDPASAVQLLRGSGITHLLIDRSGLPASLSTLPALDASYLQQNAEILYAHRNVEAYRLDPEQRRTGESRSTVSNELLRNVGFEEVDGGKPVGWNPYGSPMVDYGGSHSHGGRAAVRVTDASGFTQIVPVTPGRIYILSHYSRADAQGSSVRLQVNWLDKQEKIVGVGLNVFPATTNWTKHELSDTAPAGAAVAMIYADAHVGEVWLDDYSFRQAN